MAILDADRFNALIETRLEAPGRGAFRLVRNKVNSEDLIQETCIRAIEKFVDLREKPAQPWFRTEMH
jgi:DNA-directed RNA polymerase specialized sigma24 family protein